jgi:CRP/FNR family transcriptional regulator
MTTLAKLPYFARLERNALVTTAERAIRRAYAAGEVVFAEGDPCAGLCVVLDGWLKTVRISPAGREQVLCVIGPGQACNEIGVFAGSPNPATAIALEETTVWILRPEMILPLLDTVPGLAQEVARSLAQRTLHLLTMIEDLSLRTVEERLARLLLERSSDGTLHRYRWATQTEMAARLGTVPDVLSRALGKLADEGLIHVTRQQIRILDAEGLVARSLQGS